MKWLSYLPWRSLALAAAALAVAAVPEVVGPLRLDQSAVLGGEIWRLWTGHLVHGSAQHLAWNVAALVGLGFLFERALGRHFTWLVLVGGAVVGVGVFVLQPEIDTYLGLSGVLNTIWVGGAVIAARGERGWMRAVYFAAVVAGLAKILFETWTGISIFTDPGALGGQPLVLAHAVGSLAGCAIFGVEDPFSTRRTITERLGYPQTEDDSPITSRAAGPPMGEDGDGYLHRAAGLYRKGHTGHQGLAPPGRSVQRDGR